MPSTFAAALVEHLGIALASALATVAIGSGLTLFMSASWQLVLCWGVLVGLGTGSMAMGLAATVTGRWFLARRGVVSGVLAAAHRSVGVSPQPVLPRRAPRLASRHADRGGHGLVVVPLMLWLLRDRPADLGLPPYGGDPVGLVR